MLMTMSSEAVGSSMCNNCWKTEVSLMSSINEGSKFMYNFSVSGCFTRIEAFKAENCVLKF